MRIILDSLLFMIYSVSMLRRQNQRNKLFLNRYSVLRPFFRHHTQTRDKCRIIDRCMSESYMCGKRIIT